MRRSFLAELSRVMDRLFDLFPHMTEVQTLEMAESIVAHQPIENFIGED